jgi:RHS repeat-associated protein
VISHEAYAYDPARPGLLTSVIHQEQNQTQTRDLFGYDLLPELISAQYDQVNSGGNWITPARTCGYTFDKAGNRASITDSSGPACTYTTNSLNMYLQVGLDTVGPGSEHELSSFQNISYTYVNDTHLASVSGNGHNYQLLYDALGRCVARTMDGASTYFVYDGEKAIVEYGSAFTKTATNVYGRDIDEILQRTDYTASPARTFYYQDDHEGSVTHLMMVVNNVPTVVESYRYDAFGKPTMYNGPTQIPANVIQASAYNNRFLFTGREYVWQFGIYEYRNRAYHPGLGRFMSEDPKLFDAGDYNLFRYCANDPLDKTDPMGLEAMPDAQREAILKARLERDILNARPATYGLAVIGHSPLANEPRGSAPQGGTATTGQGGPSQGAGLDRSKYPPAIDAGLFPGMKSATDKSAEAMHRDREGFPYTVANGTGGQSEPKRGTKHEAAGHEYFREHVAYRGDLLSVGHVHNKGAAGFSDPDIGLNRPIMKNRDGYINSKGKVEQYDLYYRGWRWYLRPDMSIEAGPMRY